MKRRIDKTRKSLGGTPTYIRLPDDLRVLIDSIAQEERRTRARQIEHLLRQALEASK